MVQVYTNLSFKESARRERCEATGGITATNVQKALEALASIGPYAGPIPVAAGSYNATTTDVEIFVNFAGTVTIALPAAAAYLAAQRTAAPLTIKDVSGAAATNNITINRAGSDTIDGATSLKITSNYGGWKLRPVSSAGNWAIVG